MRQGKYLLCVGGLILGLSPVESKADAISDILMFSDTAGHYTPTTVFLTESQEVPTGGGKIIINVPQMVFPSADDTLTISSFTVTLRSDSDSPPVGPPDLGESDFVTLDIFARFRYSILWRLHNI